MKRFLLIISSVLLCSTFTACNKNEIKVLSFTALEDNTGFYAFKTNNFKDEDLPNIYYSLDSKNYFPAIINNETNAKIYPFITLNKNQTIYLKGDNPNGFSKGEYEFVHFKALNSNEDSVKFSCGGNIMSLIDDGKCDTDTIPCDYCFTYLFGETDYFTCNVINSPLLPATNLKPHCYDHMFFNNPSIESASELPSLEMKEKCYAYMFSQCISLKKGSALKSSITAPYCYDHMFYGNASIEYIEVHITDWDREGNFPCCFWVSFDGTYKMSEKGTFKCPKELVPDTSDPNVYSETRVPYHWTIETF